MKKIFTILVTGILLLGLFGVANATVIYQQQYDPTNYGAYFADDPGSRIYDNFTLSSDAQVSGATIWGVYWSNGIVPSPAIFSLNFYDSTNWSNPIYNLLLNAASVTDTGYNHNGYAPANILEISFDFATPLSLNAATQYWLGVQAINPLPNAFAWQNSLPVDRLHYLNGSPIYEDVAFSLHATSETNPVPEPSTFLLLAGGLAGITILRRRIKK